MLIVNEPMVGAISERLVVQVQGIAWVDAVSIMIAGYMRRELRNKMLYSGSSMRFALRLCDCTMMCCEAES